MELPERIALALDIVETVLAESRPLDAIVAERFKRTRALGEADRAFLVELVYGFLRRLLYYDALAALSLGEARVDASCALAAKLFLYALDAKTAHPAALADAFRVATPLSRADLRAISGAAERHRALDTIEPERDRFAALHAWPAWVVDALDVSPGDAPAARLLDGLNETPPLALRVNTLLGSVEEVAAALAREGVATRPGELAPSALVVEEPQNVFRTESFRRGLFEVQDEGSQIVSLLVDPRRGARVLDACGGAGGKTLHLGALMKGRGEVFAYDPSARRLAAAKKRVARSGLQNVRILDGEEARERFSARAVGSLDAVLVDAPCSGTGTARRNPDIKLRGSARDIAELVAKQRSILAGVAPLVRPGGRLVYATCSILPAENDAVVEEFLAENDEFSLLPAARAVAQREGEPERLRAALERDDLLRLTPHGDSTDGFFAAVLERRE